MAKYKSFSKAATILMSSQPNISRFMSNLESQLGCKLFIRSNRGVTLTLKGRNCTTMSPSLSSTFRLPRWNWLRTEAWNMAS